ncbi:MAG: DUF123 domain-containing protein [Bradymonadaceae bacterium]
MTNDSPDEPTGRRWRSTPIEGDALPDAPGAYVLEFELDGSTAFRAGAIGRVELRAGVVRYYGSAHGPGGLRARVARHLRDDGGRTHWHVDYLTREVDIERVALATGAEECELCQMDLRRTGDARIPVEGFGASDCSTCAAHLVWFPRGEAPRS